MVHIQISDTLLYLYPTVDEKAMEFFTAHAGESIEFLKTSTPWEVFIFNCYAVEDIVDFEKSEFRRSRSGLIMDIKNWYFEKAPQLPVFQLGGLEGFGLYVSESFVAKWQNSGLTGAQFIPL